MREREPMAQIINASEARQKWIELLNKVFRRETQVIVERSGIPVAAIISPHDLTTLAAVPTLPTPLSDCSGDLNAYSC